MQSDAVKLDVAVTHGAIAQVDGVARRNHRLFCLTNREGNEVVGMTGKRRGYCVRHRLHNGLELLGGNMRVGKDRVAQVVFRLTHGGLLRHKRCRQQLHLGDFSHNLVF